MQFWYVLVVRPNWELKVSKALSQLGYENYIPTVQQKRQWSDRVRTITVPVIRGYAFVRLEEKQRGLLFGLPGLQRFLFYNGKPALLPDQEIQALSSALKNANKITVENTLRPGDIYVLETGHFKGKEAVVTQVRKHQIKLLLKELGLYVLIEKS